MGVFFRVPTKTPVLKSVIETALRTPPSQVANFGSQALAMAMQADGQVSKPQFLWGRLGIAVGLLAVIGGLGVWSATVPSLDAWSKMLLNGFELILGAVVGLLGGEAATKGG